VDQPQSENAAVSAVLATMNERKKNFHGLTEKQPFQDLTVSHTNGEENPGVNFNLSFGCFPTKEDYRNFKLQSAPISPKEFGGIE
jgi:hypothetical protein